MIVNPGLRSGAANPKTGIVASRRAGWAGCRYFFYYYINNTIKYKHIINIKLNKHLKIRKTFINKKFKTQISSLKHYIQITKKSQAK
jgi:hypothetical protein